MEYKVKRNLWKRSEDKLYFPHDTIKIEDKDYAKQLIERGLIEAKPKPRKKRTKKAE